MTIALVRHGETDWNLGRRLQGATDIPLNDTGRAQAVEAAGRLARARWDRVVTSTLSRAVETGAIIARELGLPEPARHPGLVERGYGVAEGMFVPDYERAFPGDAEVEGREPREAVAARAMAALLGIVAEAPGESVLVVSHGGAIRSVLAAIAPERAFPPIRNLSAHTIRHAGDGFELLRFDERFEDAPADPAGDDIAAALLPRG